MKWHEWVIRTVVNVLILSVAATFLYVGIKTEGQHGITLTLGWLLVTLCVAMFNIVFARIKF